MWLKVIALTEELLTTAKQNGGSSELVNGTSGEASPDLQLSGITFDVSPFLICFFDESLDFELTMNNDRIF